MIVRLDMLHQR